MNNNLEFKKVKSIKRINKTQRVYNFNVPGYENYVANGFIVHNCENHKVSQQGNTKKLNFYPPQKIIKLAKDYNCSSICMTFNEPTISYEFLMDIAEEAHKKDLKFIIKTNAYVNKEPWEEICDVIDAVNVDWKGNKDSYLSMAGAKEYVVLDRIKEAYDLGVHVEISIPLHDGIKEEHLEEFGKFISSLSTDIPLHLLKIYSAFEHKNTTSDYFIDRAKFILEKYISNISIH